MRIGEASASRIDVIETCIFEVCPHEVHADKRRLAHIVASEFLAREIGAAEIRGPDMHFREEGRIVFLAVSVILGEVCPVEGYAAEVVARKVSVWKHGTMEMCSGKGCANEVCMIKMSIAEIRAAEVSVI